MEDALLLLVGGMGPSSEDEEALRGEPRQIRQRLTGGARLDRPAHLLSTAPQLPPPPRPTQKMEVDALLSPPLGPLQVLHSESSLLQLLHVHPAPLSPSTCTYRMST